jgi:hypothetical protein
MTAAKAAHMTATQATHVATAEAAAHVAAAAKTASVAAATVPTTATMTAAMGENRRSN